MNKGKVVFKKPVSKIIMSKYYDLHGNKIDEGTEELNMSGEVTIIETKASLDWEDMPSYSYTVWRVYLDGKEICKDVEVTAFHYITDLQQLLLEGCTGAG